MNKKQFDEKSINNIYNFLKRNFNTEWAESFDNAPDKSAWLVKNRDILETSPGWNKNFKIEDLLKSTKSAMESIYNTYGDINEISPERMTQLTNAYGIDKNYISKYYDMRKKQAEEVAKLNQKRWDELDKNRIEYEKANDNSYYNSPIANEYARKHYIQGHPNQAIVNEIAGKTAALADFGPPLVSLLAPTVRTAQKIAADEPVLTPGTAADFVGGALGFVGKIPGVKQAIQGTTGKIANILTKGHSKLNRDVSNIVNAKTIEESQKLAEKELQTIRTNLDNLDDAQLIQLAGESNNPIVKSKINDILKSRNDYKLANIVAGNPNVAHNNTAANIAADKVNEAEQAMDNAINNATLEFSKLEPELAVKANQPKTIFGYEGDPGTLNPIYKDVPVQDLYDYTVLNSKPSLIANVLGYGLKGAARKTAGQSIAHRKWDEIDYKPDYNENKAIDEVIKMYSDNWSLNRTPVDYDNPLIKAAYDKWYDKSKYNWDIINKLEQ